MRLDKTYVGGVWRDAEGPGAASGYGRRLFHGVDEVEAVSGWPEA